MHLISMIRAYESTNLYIDNINTALTWSTISPRYATDHRAKIHSYGEDSVPNRNANTLGGKCEMNT